MNQWFDMVRYDHWSNMAMLGVPEMMLAVLPGRIQINMLLFVACRKE